MKMDFLLIVLWIWMTQIGEPNIWIFSVRTPKGSLWPSVFSTRDLSLGSGDVEFDERQRSNIDSTRMFKLRRDLDQLDHFYKQKELNVLKARSASTHICTYMYIQYGICIRTRLFMQADTPAPQLTQQTIISPTAAFKQKYTSHFNWKIYLKPELLSQKKT